MSTMRPRIAVSLLLQMKPTSICTSIRPTISSNSIRLRVCTSA